MTKIPETAYEKHKARRYQEIKERNSHWKANKAQRIKRLLTYTGTCLIIISIILYYFF